MNKLLLSLLMVIGFSQIIVCGGDDFGSYDRCENSIVDYVDLCDETALLSMMQQNWQLLGFESSNDAKLYVDAIIDKQSSIKKFKVIRQCDETIGFVSYYEKSPVHWHIAYLVVDQNYRHQGHASAMIQLVIDEMKAAGVEKITIRVRAENKAAYELYTKKFEFKPLNYIVDRPTIDLILKL